MPACFSMIARQTPDNPAPTMMTDGTLATWEAAVAGVSLATYAQDHPELARSIEKFADGKAA